MLSNKLATAAVYMLFWPYIPDQDNADKEQSFNVVVVIVVVTMSIDCLSFLIKTYHAYDE